MTALLLTIWAAASTARCESSGDLEDAAVVLAVAQGRARDSGRSLLAELVAPHQFAVVCPAEPRTLRLGHLALGVRAALGLLDAPAWAAEARFYCGTGEEETCDARRAGFVGALRHRFYARHIGGARADGARRLALRAGK